MLYPAHSPPAIPLQRAPGLKLHYGANVLRFSLQVISERTSDRLDWLGGYVDIHGSADAKINTMISLDGFGPRLATDAYIAGVRHVVEGSSWISKVELGRPKLMI